jgi:two-component system, chemotaxis family, chemotaxis protein CheY
MKQVLIVDDSKVIRTVAKRILEAMAFETREAADGQQALTACQARMPDAILLDWNMPVMDGLSFLKALRASQGGGSPVVLFCTTENDMKHITDALTAGANEYIMKPFDRGILESKFAQAGLTA